MIVRHRSLLHLPMPHLAEERHRIGISLDIELSGGVLSRAMQACSELRSGAPSGQAAHSGVNLKERTIISTC
jgi:hypothetical protein